MKMLRETLEILSRYAYPDEYTVSAFAEHIAETLAKVPPTAVNAKVVFKTDYEGAGGWELQWERPQTEKEAAAEIAAEEQRKADRAEAERQQYLKLKEKYEKS